MNVLFKPSAEKTIIELADYITEQISMPATANKYIDKLLLFANSISNIPNTFPICKYPPWKRKNLCCVTFNKTWVFAFKIVKEKVVIYHIVNGKLLNYPS
jgi:hypothetical protein